MTVLLLTLTLLVTLPLLTTLIDGKALQHVNANATTTPDPYVTMMPIYHKCLKAVREETHPEKLNHSLVPKYCTLMRYDALKCMAHKFDIEDDGSLASRGSVLMEVAKRTGGDEGVMRLLRQFYYTCVYHDWAVWTDEQMFRNMTKRCVFGDEDECYGMFHYKSMTSHGGPGKDQLSMAPGCPIILSVTTLLIATIM